METPRRREEATALDAHAGKDNESDSEDLEEKAPVPMDVYVPKTPHPDEERTAAPAQFDDEGIARTAGELDGAAVQARLEQDEAVAALTQEQGVARSAGPDVEGSPAGPTRRSRRGIPNRKWEFLKTFDSFEDADTYRKRMEYRFVASGQNKSKRGVAKIYRCKSHLECSAQVCIREVYTVDTPKARVRFVCEKSGDHGAEEAEAPKQGIHPFYMDSVETMFASGALPQSVVSQLKAKYGDGDKKRPLPKVEQVRNRKANWKKSKVSKEWRDLTTYGQMMEWANSKMCGSREAFAAADDCETLLLDVFKSNVVAESREPTFGLVISCRALLQNLRTAFDGGDPICVSCDGTYRMHAGGWTLINFGVIGVIYDATDRKFCQRYFPCLYGFARSECKPAFTQVFESATRLAKDFLDFDLQPAIDSRDCSTAIASANTKCGQT